MTCRVPNISGKCSDPRGPSNTSLPRKNIEKDEGQNFHMRPWTILEHQSNLDENLSNERSSSIDFDPQAAIHNSQDYKYTEQPAHVICQYCSSEILTNVKRQPGIVTYFYCGIMVMLGCWCGCCLCPFYIDDLKVAYHYCPFCKRVVGVVKAI